MKRVAFVKDLKWWKQEEKRMVYAGLRLQNYQGLQKSDLMLNKRGNVVSKKASAHGKQSTWPMAVQAARQVLGIHGFQAVAKGSVLYKVARDIMQQQEEHYDVWYARNMLEVEAELFGYSDGEQDTSASFVPAAVDPPVEAVGFVAAVVD